VDQTDKEVTMGGTRAEQGDTTTPPEDETFAQKLERAARGEQGAHPVDDPELSGEDRFDAG
jgi:hypothetical protein